MNTSKLKIGDWITNGTLMKGVVEKVTDNYVSIRWTSTEREDILSKKSPLWVVLTCISS